MKDKHTGQVKEIARRLGFDFCGIARAMKLDEDARRLENWLRLGRQGSMSYMENHFDLRTDPRLLVPGAQSVITLMFNYFPEKRQNPDAPKIAKYAYGEDYHEIIRSKLKEFLHTIEEEIGAVSGRGFVDSAPVLERAWAQRSGLGWIGKNTNLINKQSGSFYFLATLITDLRLEADLPFATDHCGTCTRCIDACPTEAILPAGGVDGSKCISYFTIELKSALIPEEMQGKFQNWAFGCDICQDICPWNRFSSPHEHAELKPLPEILNFSTGEWNELTEEEFKKIFRHSPIKRAKFQGLQRNLKFLQIKKEESASELPSQQQGDSFEIKIKNFGA